MTDNVIDMPQDSDLGAKIDRLDRKVDAKFKEVGKDFIRLETKFDAKIEKLDAKIDRVGVELRTEMNNGMRELRRYIFTTFIVLLSAGLGPQLF